MDTKNDGLEDASPFKKLLFCYADLFWVSILIRIIILKFGGSKGSQVDKD